MTSSHATNRQLTKSPHRARDRRVLVTSHPPRSILFLSRIASPIKMGNATSTYLGVPISGLPGVPKSVAGATSSKP